MKRRGDGAALSLSTATPTTAIMAHTKSSKKLAKRVERPASSADGQLDSPFLHVNTDIRLSIPPVFATDLQRGAMEMLDSLVMR